MTARRTNLALLLALALAFVTGVTAFAIGTGWNRWITVQHGIAGFLIIALAPWKSLIVRRGLARHRPGSWASIALLVLVVIAIVSGLLHSTGTATDIGGLSAMQIHVGAALVSLPFALWHVLKRPVRVTPMDFARRRLLRAGAFVGGAAVTYSATEGLIKAAGLPGASRRFTGSHERGSFDPEEMPITQWLNDSVPQVDTAAWRLRLGSRSADYEELAGFTDALVATLDCTGGWFSEQDWQGVWLSELLPDLGDARSIVATSLTGYRRRYPVEDAGKILIATRVGGHPLSPGHGFPARLVVPGRRGFWWVKWLSSIEPSPAPWWLQPPFPMT